MSSKDTWSFERGNEQRSEAMASSVFQMVNFHPQLIVHPCSMSSEPKPSMGLHHLGKLLCPRVVQDAWSKLKFSLSI